jgi:hypothetical protein
MGGIPKWHVVGTLFQLNSDAFDSVLVVFVHLLKGRGLERDQRIQAVY